ncbi:MAG TPA: hypothetical protein VD971_08360 [Phycisphaerales bacterium]|nr:hypothetical protein [Phycisphaerales bacterium]
MSNHDPIQRSHDASAGAHAAHHADDWHHHDASEGMPMEEHAGTINTRIVLIWFGLIVAFFAVSVIGLMKYFDVTNTRMIGERVEIEFSGNYLAHRAEGEAALSVGPGGPRYTAVQGRKVAIPVQDAMKKVVAAYADGQRRLEDPHSAANLQK